MQQISVEELPLEKQFELQKVLQTVDDIDDPEALRNIIKDLMRLSLVNEAAHNRLKQNAIQMNEEWFLRNQNLIALIGRLEEMIKCLVMS